MLPGRCTADKRCMEPDCPDCEGLRFFSGVINGIILMAAFVLVVGAFAWFSIEVWKFWEASNGHY